MLYLRLHNIPEEAKRLQEPVDKESYYEIQWHRDTSTIWLPKNGLKKYTNNWQDNIKIFLWGGPNPKQKKAPGEIALSWNEPKIHYPILSGQPWKYMHKSNTNELMMLHFYFRDVCVFVIIATKILSY